MRYSSLVSRIGGKGAAAWSINQVAGEMRKAGREIIFLTVGNPDQSPPRAIVDATIASMRDYVGYSEVLGAPELRSAIAARVSARTGSACTTENVVVTSGAQAALYFVLRCLVEPGDEVVVPEPMYATYEAVVGASGAELVNVSLRPERNFHLDVADLERAITARTRVVWINTPGNPTGAVFSADEMRAIGSLCSARDLWLLSDEVYEELTYQRPHVSAWSLTEARDRTVVVSSISKSCAVPGFRVGWSVGPEQLTPHLYNLLLCAQYGGPPFLQDGALAWFDSEQPAGDTMREIYSRRATALATKLAHAPSCTVVRPEGGMFVLLDIRATGLDSNAFAMRLLEEQGVATLACDGFGPSATGHIRLSLTKSDEQLDEAARRLVTFARQLASR